MDTNYYDDITELFEQLISQAGQMDVANAEFVRMINEDRALLLQYREWCHENGTTERRGFRDYCEEYLDSQSEIFDTLSDPDE